MTAIAIPAVAGSVQPPVDEVVDVVDNCGSAGVTHRRSRRRTAFVRLSSTVAEPARVRFLGMSDPLSTLSTAAMTMDETSNTEGATPTTFTMVDAGDEAAPSAGDAQSGVSQ